MEAAPVGATGFDTDTKLTASSASAFAAAGFRFAIRYLTRDAPEADTDLTRSEALDILDAGLALMAVQHVAPSGWVPGASLGAEYGAYAAANARSVGLPYGVSVWLDLEGVAEGTPTIDVIAYCNAWYDPVAAAGYVPGLYVGANSGLDGFQLFAGSRFERYWQSGSDVPEVAMRGYCLVQSIDGATIDGVAYDSDVVQADKFKDLPFWLAPALLSAETTAAPSGETPPPPADDDPTG